MVEMLTDTDYTLKMSIPDLTDKVDSNELRALCDDSFQGDLYGADTWKCAWYQADHLNEKHYEDHISFCVVKCCQNYYVFDKQVARKKLGLDIR